ncbi:hypothetical protein ZWY2020_003273 [Hordeum vulgare]|nr:hypothetical protein ZWY2020_003273 [Hordeum vulgare]
MGATENQPRWEASERGAREASAWAEWSEGEVSLGGWWGALDGGGSGGVATKQRHRSCLVFSHLFARIPSLPRTSTPPPPPPEPSFLPPPSSIASNPAPCLFHRSPPFLHHYSYRRTPAASRRDDPARPRGCSIDSRSSFSSALTPLRRPPPAPLHSTDHPGPPPPVPPCPSAVAPVLRPTAGHLRSPPHCAAIHLRGDAARTGNGADTNQRGHAELPMSKADSEGAV